MLVVQKKISRTLMLYILFFSSIVTLLATAITLYIEYKHDIQSIEVDLDQIQTSYLESISNSLWQFDSIQLRSLVNGISRLPEVVYVEVEAKDSVIYSVGTKFTENKIERIYKLKNHFRHDDNGRVLEEQLGSLKIIASLKGVYKRLRVRMVLVLLTQGIKTFLVSIFIYLMVQHLITRHLAKMAVFVSKFDLKAQTPPLKLDRRKDDALDELDHVENAINDMHAKLRQNYAELQLTEENLRKLSMKLISSQEQERAKISRDLHDDIGQKLTVLKLNFAKHFRTLQMSDKDLQLRRSIIFSEIDELMNGIRHVARSLLPSILYDFGISDAIKWLLEESFKNSSIEYRADLNLGIDIKEKDLNLTIFRIVQESLNNIIKYANATFVEVQLFIESDNIIIMISDDGIGITKSDMEKTDSSGLVGIIERLRPYHGTLEIGARKIGGTLSKVTIPLRHV